MPQAGAVGAEFTGVEVLASDLEMVEDDLVPVSADVGVDGGWGSGLGLPVGEDGVEVDVRVVGVG